MSCVIYYDRAGETFRICSEGIHDHHSTTISTMMTPLAYVLCYHNSVLVLLERDALQHPNNNMGWWPSTTGGKTRCKPWSLLVTQCPTCQIAAYYALASDVEGSYSTAPFSAEVPLLTFCPAKLLSHLTDSFCFFDVCESGVWTTHLSLKYVRAPALEPYRRERRRAECSRIFSVHCKVY